MLGAVNEFGLWARADFARNPDVDDGAQWVVEGRRGDGYHPVLLINSDSEVIEQLAAVFLRMASVDPNMLREGVDVPGK